VTKDVEMLLPAQIQPLATVEGSFFAQGRQWAFLMPKAQKTDNAGVIALFASGHAYRTMNDNTMGSTLWDAVSAGLCFNCSVSLRNFDIFSIPLHDPDHCSLITGKYIMALEIHATVCANYWAALRLEIATVETGGEQHISGVQVRLNALNPISGLVKPFDNGVNGGASLRRGMKRVREAPGVADSGICTAYVFAVHPPADHSTRMMTRRSGVPTHPGCARNIWQP